MSWCIRATLVFVIAVISHPSHLFGDEIEERLEKERDKHAAVLERLD